MEILSYFVAFVFVYRMVKSMQTYDGATVATFANAHSYDRRTNIYLNSFVYFLVVVLLPLIKLS